MAIRRPLARNAAFVTCTAATGSPNGGAEPSQLRSSVVKNSHHGGSTADNPNRFFVFAFEDADLPNFVPQRFHRDDDHDGFGDGDRDDRGR